MLRCAYKCCKVILADMMECQLIAFHIFIAYNIETSINTLDLQEHLLGDEKISRKPSIVVDKPYGKLSDDQCIQQPKRHRPRRMGSIISIRNENLGFIPENEIISSTASNSPTVNSSFGSPVPSATAGLNSDNPQQASPTSSSTSSYLTSHSLTSPCHQINLPFLSLEPRTFMKHSAHQGQSVLIKFQLQQRLLITPTRELITPTPTYHFLHRLHQKASVRMYAKHRKPSRVWNHLLRHKIRSPPLTQRRQQHISRRQSILTPVRGSSISLSSNLVRLCECSEKKGAKSVLIQKARFITLSLRTFIWLKTDNSNY